MIYAPEIINTVVRFVKRSGFIQRVNRTLQVTVSRDNSTWEPIRTFTRFENRILSVVVSRKFKVLPTYEHYLLIVAPPVGPWTTWGDDGVYPWQPPIDTTPFSNYP